MKSPKIHEDTKEFSALIKKIDGLLNAKPHVIVAVSGFGGSGKTTLAEKIKNHFPSSTWVQLDNFLIDHGQGDGWAGGYDWDRFEKVLRGIKDGKDLHYQAYDWHKDALTDWYIDEELPQLIIVEGVRILQPKLISYFDISLWIECDINTATARGIARDRQNWKDKSDQEGLEAHLQTWSKVWVPKEKEFYKEFRPDQLANYTYNPDSKKTE